MTVTPKIISRSIYGGFTSSVTTSASQEEASESSVRLSIVTQFFPPDYAATGQLIEELVKHLGRKGMDIKVFTGQPGYAFQSENAPTYEERGTVKIHRSRVTKFASKRIRGAAIGGLLFAFRALLHVAKNFHNRNLLLVTTAPPFLPIIGYLLNFFFGIPYICLIYDIHPDISVELGMIRKDHPIVKVWTWINKQVWRNAQEIIVLSSNMKDRLVGHCPEVNNKITVIHSWADPDKIRPIAKQDNWFAKKHNLTEKFTVLYSGNMGRCHDIDTIFDAALKLKDEPIQFVCIGKGAKQDSLKEKIQKHGLSNFVFLPYQDKKDLAYSLSACDVSLVTVSEGVEGLVAPSKVYGYLASGRPIAAVCPECTYLNEMFKQGQCGESFVNGDSEGLAGFILKLSQNPEFTEKMGKSARRFLETHFSPETIANQYGQVLQNNVFNLKGIGDELLKGRQVFF